MDLNDSGYKMYLHRNKMSTLISSIIVIYSQEISLLSIIFHSCWFLLLTGNKCMNDQNCLEKFPSVCIRRNCWFLDCCETSKQTNKAKLQMSNCKWKICFSFYIFSYFLSLWHGAGNDVTSNINCWIVSFSGSKLKCNFHISHKELFFLILLHH